MGWDFSFPSTVQPVEWRNLNQCSLFVYLLMSSEKVDVPLCGSCGEPLFLDKEECKAFIEGRLKEGFIVCSCCGTEKKPE